MEDCLVAPQLAPAGENYLNWGPAALAHRRIAIRNQQAVISKIRSSWIRKNPYYYSMLKRILRFFIEPNCRILHLGSQTGYLLSAVNPSRGVGVEISKEMIEIAEEENPGFSYIESFPENFEVGEKFDYILFTGLSETVDAYAAFRNLLPLCEDHTRIIVNTYNHLWEPIVDLAAWLRLKVPQSNQNWFSDNDIANIFELSGLEVLKTHRSILFPYYIPIVSTVLNRFIANLPLVNRLCFLRTIVARPKNTIQSAAHRATGYSVSIIIPCKNEKGNVEAAVKRIPSMGSHTEIIFCDDKSTDGTADEVRRMQALYPEKDIRLLDGPGICKSENVWTGFNQAKGDILMILDADLTVMPEELPMFFTVITEGHAEFVNGSRLVYPVPHAAMKTGNMMGNKAFTLLFSYILGQTVKDTLCGTKVIWRRDWLRIKRYLHSWGIHDRWGDYELLLGASKLNLKIMDLPVHYQERIFGTTKMVRVFHNGVRMLSIVISAVFRLKFCVGAPSKD